MLIEKSKRVAMTCGSVTWYQTCAAIETSWKSWLRHLKLTATLWSLTGTSEIAVPMGLNQKPRPRPSLVTFPPRVTMRWVCTSPWQCCRSGTQIVFLMVAIVDSSRRALQVESPPYTARQPRGRPRHGPKLQHTAHALRHPRDAQIAVRAPRDHVLASSQALDEVRIGE